MEKYLYSSHTSGYFTSNEKYNEDVLYCEECGDYDTFIGSFKDEQSLRDLLKDCNKKYVDKIVAQTFPPSKNINNFKNPVLMKNGEYVEKEEFDNKYNINPKTFANEYKVNNYKAFFVYNVLGMKTRKMVDDKLWFNESIKAVCTSGSFGYDVYDVCDFWIGLYKDGHIEFNFSTGDGMCGYEFDEFGKIEDMNNPYDYKCQAEALRRINWLIDKKYIVKKEF